MRRLGLIANHDGTVESGAERFDGGSTAGSGFGGKETERPWTRVVERRVFRVLLVLAGLSLLLAVVSNWLWVPWEWGSGSLRVKLPALGSNVPVPGIRTPVRTLPERVLSYETIARQAAPGREGHAVEALYVTMDMNIEAQVSIAVYARAESFMSDAEALKRANEMLGPYSAKPAIVGLGAGNARGRSGYSPTLSAYCVAWVKNATVFFVKSTFRDRAPVQKRDFLRQQANPVIKAIVEYNPNRKTKTKL